MTNTYASINEWFIENTQGSLDAYIALACLTIVPLVALALAAKFIPNKSRWL